MNLIIGHLQEMRCFLETLVAYYSSYGAIAFSKAPPFSLLLSPPLSGNLSGD